MKDVKAPDLNAPRFRKKVLNTLGKKFIREIKEEVPELKNVSEEEIRKVVREFNKLIVKTVIEVRDGVELPEQLGHIFIGSCKRMKSNVDFRTSAAYLKKIQHRNWESDERTAKIFYTNSGVFFTKGKVTRYGFKNQELWGFKGSRKFTRTVSKFYPDYWKRYIEIDPTKKLKFSYLKEINKRKGKDYEEMLLETYNPFE